MSLAGELIAAFELPWLMNEHCSHVAPEFSEPNTRALQAWLTRHAPLFERAHERARAEEIAGLLDLIERGHARA